MSFFWRGEKKAWCKHLLYCFVFRYFVIKTDTFGHVGLGFADRTDAFDLNVALQDHFKSLRLEEQIQKESEAPVEKLDLSLKEGQTIKASFFTSSKKTIKALKIKKSAKLSHLSSFQRP